MRSCRRLWWSQRGHRWQYGACALKHTQNYPIFLLFHGSSGFVTSLNVTLHVHCLCCLKIIKVTVFTAFFYASVCVQSVKYLLSPLHRCNNVSWCTHVVKMHPVCYLQQRVELIAVTGIIVLLRIRLQVKFELLFFFYSHKTNIDIVKELNITPGLYKIQYYKRNWI
jgi:glycerol-3-phosphate acyltransferase PlsY